MAMNIDDPQDFEKHIQDDFALTDVYGDTAEGVDRTYELKCHLS